MNPLALHQFFVLYLWFVTAALLLFMASIARFYQRFSGKRMFAAWYAVPTVLFGVAAVRHARHTLTMHDPISDLLLGLGGLVLLGLSVRLSFVMLNAKRPS
ncbi:MAG: hypothetical protein NZ750_13855 [Anaerolineae bacterium]|nr:hypothetical protein [Anaerolineae bacterium]MDW8172884.1 hypothetical protein [Anaerolineae bacterium]